MEIEVGDWRSGYYDIELTDAAGVVRHHMLCVKPARGKASAAIALVLTTNTLHAYNYWGGASAYCDVDALMSGRADLATAMQGAIGELSAERPFAPMLLAPPEGIPRLVNLTPRGFERRPWAGADGAWSKTHNQTPYDGSAGFLHKWEHAFVRWAEGEGIALDYLTDYDLEVEPDCLDAYACVVLAGHSEYWSAPERETLERFVDSGGGLAILSGNTAFWKVRWENGGKTMICRKWKGFEDGTGEPSDATHLWSHPAFGRPEAEITGLSFLFGGYHRLGLCVARGSGGYTIYRNQHWALKGCDLYYGDVIARTFRSWATRTTAACSISARMACLAPFPRRRSRESGDHRHHPRRLRRGAEPLPPADSARAAAGGQQDRLWLGQPRDAGADAARPRDDGFIQAWRGRGV